MLKTAVPPGYKLADAGVGPIKLKGVIYTLVGTELVTEPALLVTTTT